MADPRDLKTTEATAQRIINMLEPRPWCDSVSEEPAMDDEAATFIFTDKWGRIFKVRVTRDG